MNILSKKTITAALGALTLGAAIVATSTPAAAWGHRHHGGWGWRGPAVVGALALGALAAGSAYSYAGSAYSYAGECYISRQPVTNRWGDVVGYRRVRVCE